MGLANLHGNLAHDTIHRHRWSTIVDAVHAMQHGSFSSKLWAHPHKLCASTAVPSTIQQWACFPVLFRLAVHVCSSFSMWTVSFWPYSFSMCGRCRSGVLV